MLPSLLLKSINFDCCLIVFYSFNDCNSILVTVVKVDLTAYVEKHEFCFDHVTNDDVLFFSASLC